LFTKGYFYREHPRLTRDSGECEDEEAEAGGL